MLLPLSSGRRRMSHFNVAPPFSFHNQLNDINYRVTMNLAMFRRYEQTTRQDQTSRIIGTPDLRTLTLQKIALRKIKAFELST